MQEVSGIQRRQWKYGPAVSKRKYALIHPFHKYLLSTYFSLGTIVYLIWENEVSITFLYGINTCYSQNKQKNI